MDKRGFGVSVKEEQMELLLEDFRENLHAEKSSVSRSSGSCLESVMSMKTSAKSLELGSNAAEGPSIKLKTKNDNC